MHYILTAVLFFMVITGSLRAQGNLSADDIYPFAVPFQSISDFDPLFDEIKNQRLVLLGESTHGTSEYYLMRGELSKRLITEKGYGFIAVEGDWPAIARINEYVKHKETHIQNIDEAMAVIERWPLWMWRNGEFRDLVEWIRDYNTDLPQHERVGLYGIDLYAYVEAMQSVIEWLESVDDAKATRAVIAYNCLLRYSEIRSYIQTVASSGETCSEEMNQVLEIVRNTDADDGWLRFNAEQNAKVAINAELHFSANLLQDASSWNYRAQHFNLITSRLLDYYGSESKGIVWAHNTHIGDARATAMARAGAVNIGQLSRLEHGIDNIYAIGFGTYTGTVLASGNWEGPMLRMNIPEARQGSWEYLLAATGHDQLFILFNSTQIDQLLSRFIHHRAIGVTYNPQADQNNYVETIMPDRYNAFIFYRTTSALDALDQ
jgi:erythromycin esterase-like protein